MRRRFCIILLWGFCVSSGVGVLIPKVFGLAESTGPNGSNAQAVHDLGETGDGVNVGLISRDNARVTHEAFHTNGEPNAFAYDATGDGIKVSSHDTSVAGIIASRGGISEPAAIGVAPGANIYSARVVDDNSFLSSNYLIDALQQLIDADSCRVIVTSIQIYDETTPADGDSDWTKIYDYFAYDRNVVFANAAGNYVYDPCSNLLTDKITIFGDAYNGITTGGLRFTNPNYYNRTGSRSCLGPTEDNRKKPEITAPSQSQIVPRADGDSSWGTVGSAYGQTSYSVPHTAGVAALLLGLADEMADADAARNEVIKAVIVNSTFPNINDRNNDITTGQTYHDHRGYGRIDALRAYDVLSANRIFNTDSTTEPKGWAFEYIQKQPPSKRVHTYTIYVKKNERLIVTVTWNRHVSSGYVAENPILNLDMVIEDPDALTVFSETDTKNNLEKVDIVAQKTGSYTITITNKDNSSMRDNTYYGLAFEVLPPIPGDFNLNYIVDSRDLHLFVDQWLQTGLDLDADLFADDSIDLKDFSVFTQHWLDIDPAYYNQ